MAFIFFISLRFGDRLVQLVKFVTLFWRNGLQIGQAHGLQVKFRCFVEILGYKSDFSQN